MADSCCHCVNIENPDIGKYFKAKRITDDCIKEDGKKYFKLQWEDTWAEEEDLQSCTDLLQEYSKTGKPRMDLLAHTENTEDNTCVFVLRVHSTGVKADNGNLTVYGLDGQHLIDKMSEMSKAQKVSLVSEQDDVKMITYAQLQKAGFLVEEEENSNSVDRQDVTTTQPPQQQSQTTQQLPIVASDTLESVKFHMYSQVATNNVVNDKYTLEYIGNDIDQMRGVRRTFPTRRRHHPFQLYKCEICASEFVHRTHLKIHQRTHTGEKPYKCEYCGRCFAQKGNLHVHVKIHTGVKDFICEYCHRAFVTNAQLFVHMRTHTNPNRKRPYATGRPSKSDSVESTKSNSSSEPDQIIVQLIADKTSKDKKDQHNGDFHNSGDIPSLVVGEDELENLSDETGAMNNLPSLQSGSQQESYMRAVDEQGTNNNNNNSRDIVRALAAQ